MTRPLFSCVMPVKGARPYMEEALASLLAQGMGDELEVIVQDADVEPDAGQSDALNKGFARAKGEWLFWLNADDVLLPGALGKVKGEVFNAEKQRSREAEENVKGEGGGVELNWIVGDTVYLDEKGIVKDVRCDARWRPWFGKSMSVWTGGPSAFFRRELWERIGGLDTSLKYVMDIDLWTRWAKAGERFDSLMCQVWGFRMHDGSKTMNGKNCAEQKEELARVDAMHGVSSMGFWRNVTRVASIVDGSWMKRKHDSVVLHNRHWKECKA